MTWLIRLAWPVERVPFGQFCHNFVIKMQQTDSLAGLADIQGAY
jgi:hypothetical protein